jgi:hypothetical protein
MDEREKRVITDILILLLANERTSASKEGLNFRAENRKKALMNCLNLLNITTEEAEDLYWNWRIEMDLRLLERTKEGEECQDTKKQLSAGHLVTTQA